MTEQSRPGAHNNGRDLGASFEQANSPTFSGDLGPAFVEKNRGKITNPRRKWYWIGGLCLLVLLIVLIHHFSGDTTGTKGADGAAASNAGGGGRRGAGGPATITVGQTTTGNMPVYVQALGTVTPTYTVTLYSQVTGRVLAVHYTEGQFVKKGQPLVDIDPQPYEATLQQAEGQLKHDQGVLGQAQMDLSRYQDAAAKGAIARQQLEDQAKIVVQDEGTVQSDEGTVQGDKVQLAYTHIVAPISGRVGLRLVDPGNTVFSGSSSTLVVITALQPITVVFNVSEDDLPSVQAQLKGHNVLRVDAFDRSDNNILDTGKLTSLDNQIDTTTGTVKFRASFSNSKLNLFPNQFVNARLLLKTLNNTVLVPNAAVQHNGTAAFVYIVKDAAKGGGQTVAVQNITTSTNDDKNTAATGVGPNVTLATSGFDRLEPGAKVRLAQPGGKGGKGGGGKGGGSSDGDASAANNESPASTQPAGAGTAAGTANGAGNGAGAGNAGSGDASNGQGNGNSGGAHGRGGGKGASGNGGSGNGGSSNGGSSNGGGGSSR